MSTRTASYTPLARRVAAVVAASVAMLGLGNAPAHAAEAVRHGGQPGVFCPCWGGGPKSQAAWDDAARNLSLIAGGQGIMEKNYARSKQLNPDVLILPYALGPYLSKNSQAYTDTLRDHPDRFARTSDGKLINVPDFPNNYLMDVTNPGLAQQQADISAAAATKLDGVYVDSMGLAPITGSYTSGHPADQSTKTNYSPSVWMAGNRDTLSAIKTRLGSKYVMFNGLSNGTTYTQGSKLLADSTADGGMTEAWIRGAKTTLSSYPTAKKFQLELDEASDMLAKGKEFFAWTKAWGSGTEQQKQDWNTFALGAFLLVDNGHGFYNFLPDNTSDRSVLYSPTIETMDLGLPSGPYTTTNGVYTRQYANGTVTVNVTAKTASIVHS